MLSAGSSAAVTLIGAAPVNHLAQATDWCALLWDLQRQSRGFRFSTHPMAAAWGSAKEWRKAHHGADHAGSGVRYALVIHEPLANGRA